LKCGNELVKNGTLQLKHYPLQQSVLNGSADGAWINYCIAPSNPVVFIDTDGLGKGLEGVGPVNQVESVITARLVTALSTAGLDASSIGIITPFRSQVSTLPFLSENVASSLILIRIKFLLQLRVMTENPVISEAKNIGLELGTVDVFQGRDKPAIILSLVRSNLEGKTGRLLQDFRRLNVAFSRAKQKLIMVGSFTTLYAGSDVMRPVLDSIRQRGWIFYLSSL
jgi:DNA replication ATP-dependent helicase Dna2